MNKPAQRPILLGLMLILAAAMTAPALRAAGRDWPAYKPVAHLSGSARCLSSASPIQLAGRWQEAFGKTYPKVRFTVDNSDAAGAFEAFLAGQTHMILLGQPLTTRQQQQFEKKFGHAPLRLVLARDALTIYVNRDNPITGLTLQQVDAIFSSSRKRGGRAVGTWADLGLSGAWSGRAVDRVHGLGPGSGIYESFQQQVLRGGRFISSMKIEPGASSVVNAVGAYPQAIGFSNHHFRSRRVRQVPLAVRSAGPFVAPTDEACFAGRYPLMRDLVAYVNREPGKPLEAVLQQWLVYVCSEPGQKIVQQKGDIPIDPATAQRQIGLLR